MVEQVPNSVNDNVYRAVRRDPAGAGVRELGCGVVSLLGRDRLSFLQGQVTNDIVRLMPGQGAHACLLNNTGHMLADLYIYAFPDRLLIETDHSRTAEVAATLDRFLVREKVVIEEETALWKIVTLQGAGASAALREIVPAPLAFQESLSHGDIGTAFGDVDAFAVSRTRTLAPEGYDLWLPKEYAPAAMERLSALPGVVTLDDTTYDLLRIEAGIPCWGAELDESVIPLEAGFLDAISFTKGCYMGQEIIARIRARGHTNRTLRGLRLSTPVSAGEKLVAQDGPRAGDEIGRITSSVVSPEFGPIALGYVRNEYTAAGVSLSVGNATATVTDLPFTGAPA